MHLYIEISSKNKTALKIFLNCITKLLQNYNVNLTSIPKQQITKTITVLKSPHVNKTAQEQFEFRIYSSKYQIKSVKFIKCFIAIKKLITESFSGINVKIKSIFDHKLYLKNVSSTLNPDNLSKICLKIASLKDLRKKSKPILFLLKSFGNLSLKNDMYDNILK